MDKISKVLKNTYDLPIKACFIAKVFGGTEDAFSKQQQELVLKTLRNIGISCNKDIAQIAFDARSGEATLETNVNKRLELCSIVNMGSGTIS